MSNSSAELFWRDYFIDPKSRAADIDAWANGAKGEISGYAKTVRSKLIARARAQMAEGKPDENYRETEQGPQIRLYRGVSGPLAKSLFQLFQVGKDRFSHVRYASIPTTTLTRWSTSKFGALNDVSDEGDRVVLEHWVPLEDVLYHGECWRPLIDLPEKVALVHSHELPLRAEADDLTYYPPGMGSGLVFPYKQERLEKDATPAPLSKSERNPYYQPASDSHIWQAAEWLSGKTTNRKRAELVATSGNSARAALRAHDLPDTSEMVAKLQELADMMAPRAGTPKQDEDSHVFSVQAFRPSGEDVAEDVAEALSSGQYHSIHLEGRHVRHSYVASGKKKRWLLKPGSDGLGTERGVTDTSASSSDREAAFYHIAELVAHGTVPRTEKLLIDQVPYAAVELLDLPWETAVDLEKERGARVEQIFYTAWASGQSLVWAWLDYVLGQPDRHGNNVLVNPDTKQVRFIDHGSAFAGKHFDPGKDSLSYIPYYLRVLFHGWDSLSTKEKLERLPSLPPGIVENVYRTVGGVSMDQVQKVLSEYGLTNTYVLQRMRSIPLDARLPEALWRKWLGAEELEKMEAQRPGTDGVVRSWTPGVPHAHVPLELMVCAGKPESWKVRMCVERLQKSENNVAPVRAVQASDGTWAVEAGIEQCEAAKQLGLTHVAVEIDH